MHEANRNDLSASACSMLTSELSEKLDDLVMCVALHDAAKRSLAKNPAALVSQIIENQTNRVLLKAAEKLTDSWQLFHNAKMNHEMEGAKNERE